MHERASQAAEEAVVKWTFESGETSWSSLNNVDLVVEDWPVREQLAGHVIDEGDYLLGLYEGVPLTERADYGMVLPDKITLFQKAIESICSSDEEVVTEVRNTVVHEVAHHFGIDDDALTEMGI